LGQITWKINSHHAREGKVISLSWESLRGNSIFLIGGTRLGLQSQYFSGHVAISGVSTGKRGASLTSVFRTHMQTQHFVNSAAAKFVRLSKGKTIMTGIHKFDTHTLRYIIEEPLMQTTEN
jgi:hypothetical protein